MPPLRRAPVREGRVLFLVHADSFGLPRLSSADCPPGISVRAHLAGPGPAVIIISGGRNDIGTSGPRRFRLAAARARRVQTVMRRTARRAAR